MKSNIFKDVLEEITLEVNENKEETIAKLRLQMGFCSSQDSDDDQLFFWCTKKGKLGFFTQPTRESSPLPYFYYYNMDSRIYSVRGKVLSENGKTVVKLYSVYNRLNSALRLIDLVTTFLVLALVFVIKGFTRVESPPGDLLKLVGALILAGVSTFIFTSEKRNKYSDLELMKQEVINRVKAVDRWDV